MSLELRKINNYRFTNQLINDIIMYKLHQIVPATLNTQRQRTSFFDKFDSNDWVVQHHSLFYRPNPNLSLQVARPHQIPAILQQVFQDFRRGLGTGESQFYHSVASQFLNIKRTQSTAFLRQQGDYVLPRPYQKRVNKPILATCPNERWSMDLIDLSKYQHHNNGFRYILTVVDFFSRKVFARPMRTRTNAVTRNALQQIFVASNTIPRTLQFDSGNEFNGNQINAFFAQQPNLRIVRIQPYTPTTNGLVERMNKEVRKKIANGFIRQNSLQWVQHLNDYIDNINSQKSSRTGFTPDQLWSQGYNPNNNPQNHRLTDHSTNAERQEYVQHRLRATAQRIIQRGRQPNVFQVGDRVRVQMTRFYPALRKLIKEHHRKQIIVTYTPEIYTVSAVRPQAPNGRIRNTQYELTNVAGQLLQSGGNPKLFFGSELILIPVGDTPASVPNALQANALNLV